jgi:hypothetical protein
MGYQGRNEGAGVEETAPSLGEVGAARVRFEPVISREASVGGVEGGSWRAVIRDFGSERIIARWTVSHVGRGSPATGGTVPILGGPLEASSPPGSCHWISRTGDQWHPAPPEHPLGASESLALRSGRPPDDDEAASGLPGGSSSAVLHWGSSERLSRRSG